MRESYGSRDFPLVRIVQYALGESLLPYLSLPFPCKHLTTNAVKIKVTINKEPRRKIDLVHELERTHITRTNSVGL